MFVEAYLTYAKETKTYPHSLVDVNNVNQAVRLAVNQHIDTVGPFAEVLGVFAIAYQLSFAAWVKKGLPALVSRTGSTGRSKPRREGQYTGNAGKGGRWGGGGGGRGGGGGVCCSEGEEVVRGGLVCWW